MSKKLLLSLFATAVVIPLFSMNASANPARGEQGSRPAIPCDAPCCADPQMSAMWKRMQDPKFMEMMQPVREANRELFLALETGDTKTIQTKAKQLANTMKGVKDADVKKMLVTPIHLAELMSTGNPTYRELLTTYALLKQETARFHPHRNRYRFPRLMIDTKTYTAITNAYDQMQILVNAFATDSESAINTKIDTLMNTLKTVKTPQLQAYITPILTTLTEMKKEKGIMAKLTYKQLLTGRVSQLSMITKEKE